MSERREGGSSPWLLFERPKPLDIDPGLTNRIRLEFVTVGSRLFDREQQLTEELWSRYIQGLPHHQAFQTALNLFLRFRQIHAPVQKATGPRSIAVMSDLQLDIIDRIAFDNAESIPESYGAKLDEQTRVLETTRDWNDQWFLPKLFRMSHAVAEWQGYYGWADKIISRLGTVEAENAEDIKRVADEIWDRTIHERRYGLKNCFFSSPLFLEHPQVFFVFDPELINEQGQGGDNRDRRLREFLTKPFAYLSVVDRPKFNLTPQKVDRHYLGGVQFYGLHVEGSRFNFSVSTKGELKPCHQSPLSIERIFDKKNASKEFELLRLFLIMRLHDLVVPVEVADSFPSIDTFEQEALKSKEGGFLGLRKRLKRIEYKILSLPRVRYLEPPERVEEKLEGEKRFVDKHHVTWFVRRLPVGYHATPSATEYALEHNISLEEGETIVREHWRGMSRGGQVDNRPTKASFRKKRAPN